MEPTFAAIASAMTIAGSAVAAYGGNRFAAGREVEQKEAIKAKIADLEKKILDEVEIVHERISKTQREHDLITGRHSEKLDTLLGETRELKGILETFIKLQGGK